ncbi:MAG: DNA adenine methylase [Bacteroidota bacterium]
MKKYTGNKNIPGVYQKIINEIPDCNTFIELFAGSAAISKILKTDNTTSIYLNDINECVLNRNVCTVLNAEIFNLNYEDFLTHYNTLIRSSRSTTIFADPPYMHETRPSQKKLYVNEMSNDDHIQLLSTLLQQIHNVIIIHPKNKLYDQMLTGWRIKEIKIRYNKKTSIENLYMNFPDPKELLDYSYIGSNCWERQRIKRQQVNIYNKIAILPGVQRNAILKKLSQSTF